jgi:lactoylglutathione lyase
LHFGLRVADLDRSLAFYAALGYEVVGEVPDSPLGRLTMLKLPGDEFITVELVHDPEQPGADGPSHFVIQVESMDGTLRALAAQGIDTDAPASPDGTDDFLITWVTDPDGIRTELVQWPAGRTEGMGPADFDSNAQSSDRK